MDLPDRPGLSTYVVAIGLILLVSIVALTFLATPSTGILTDVSGRGLNDWAPAGRGRPASP